MPNETTANADFHYYEPAKGHGLAHDPFKAIVGPRPIGWISSRDANGRVNLAPYSYFNAFHDKPPIVAFGSTGWKDSIRNIQETGEFVANLATRPLAEAMNRTSATVDADVDEFALAGLTPARCQNVAVPRVAESPTALECKLLQVVQQHDLGVVGGRLLADAGQERRPIRGLADKLKTETGQTDGEAMVVRVSPSD